MGDVEGLTYDEVEARWPDLAAALASGVADVAWPGGDPAGALTHAGASGLVGRRDRTTPDGRREPWRADPARARLAAVGPGSDVPGISPGEIVRVPLSEPARTGG